MANGSRQSSAVTAHLTNGLQTDFGSPNGSISAIYKAVLPTVNFGPVQHGKQDTQASKSNHHLTRGIGDRGTSDTMRDLIDKIQTQENHSPNDSGSSKKIKCKGNRKR